MLVWACETVDYLRYIDNSNIGRYSRYVVPARFLNDCSFSR